MTFVDISDRLKEHRAYIGANGATPPPEGPQPLLRELPKGDPYPVEKLGPLRDMVTGVHELTQAPIAIAAQSALSVASLAVQAHADVETLAGYVPTSLFCLTVAQSGERKSACDRLVMDALRQFERDRMADYRLELDQWQTTHRLWTTKRDRLVKEAAGSNEAKAIAAEADLAALGSEPAQPRSPKLTTSEPTLEGLFKLFQTGEPSLGLFTDEGGGFLGGHAMNSDNRLKTVAGLSCLWGGDSLDRVRSGDGATTLYGRRLASHIMVQPVAARPLLEDPIAAGQGFLARFLITEPQSAIGTRLSRDPSNVAKVAVVAGGDRLKSLLAHPKPYDEDSPNELAPRRLPLSSAARQLLVQYYDATEAAQRTGGEFEHVRSFASKSPEQAARIAGVLALWADIETGEVDVDTMADAIELAQFYLSEAKRLAEAATISAQTELAEKLRLWVFESWPSKARAMHREPGVLIPRDVVQHGPGSMRETKVAKALLQILSDHGWLQPLEKGTVVDGQSRTVAYRLMEGSR